ncbi:MAG: hypothetical protein AB7E49_11765 [Campylobacterales bacterium]
MKTLLAATVALLFLSACSKQPEKQPYQPSHQQQIEGSDRAIRALDREKY